MHTYTEEEKLELTALVQEGINTLSQIDVLKDSLGDKVKVLSENLEVKPALLNRAIRVAYRAELDAKREEQNRLESILEAAGLTVNFGG